MRAASASSAGSEPPSCSATGCSAGSNPSRRSRGPCTIGGARHHLGVQQRALRQQPVQEPAVPIRPVHHRRHGKAAALPQGLGQVILAHGHAYTMHTGQNQGAGRRQNCNKRMTRSRTLQNCRRRWATTPNKGVINWRLVVQFSVPDVDLRVTAKPYTASSRERGPRSVATRG